MPDLAAAALVDEELAAELRERRQHRLEQVLQVAVFVVVVGGWEIAAQTGFADPFFFGAPSGIANTIWRWTTRGTPAGPLWQHVAVTLEETILAFLIGVAIGVVAGFALGRNRDHARTRRRTHGAGSDGERAAKGGNRRIPFPTAWHGDLLNPVLPQATF